MSVQHIDMRDAAETPYILINFENTNTTKNLTLASGGKHERLWVILTHPVNDVYLLQCLSDSIFILGVTGNVG